MTAKLPEKPNRSAQKQFVVIINPSKKHADKIEREILIYFESMKLDRPRVMYTSVESAGFDEAKEAVLEGADVVLACGGDGTVRQVAAGILAGMKHQRKTDQEQELVEPELAVVPIGTGNLFARNLNLPLDDLSAALNIAVFGRSHNIDLGFCKLDDDLEEHAFTVISGVGFDANLVQGTNPEAKKKIGYLAYFMAGGKKMFSRSIKLRALIKTPKKKFQIETKLRSLMVGNCGKIPGFQLIPDAKYDDGLLDVVAINTTAGIVGWLQVATDVFLQNFGIGSKSRLKIGRIDFLAAEEVQLELAKPQIIQVDGDLIGKASKITFWIEKAAIKVRLLKTSSQ
jgi:diacylglycerol kinase family enzyme